MQVMPCVNMQVINKEHRRRESIVTIVLYASEYSKKICNDNLVFLRYLKVVIFVAYICIRV